MNRPASSSDRSNSWPEIPDLFQCLVTLIQQVPIGCVTTYGDLADALGDRKAARWVGEFLLSPEWAKQVPRHRVVLANGDLGRFYAESVQPDEEPTMTEQDAKSLRLIEEGIEVRDGRVDLDRYRFNDFETSSPLTVLRTFQEGLHGDLVVEPYPGTPTEIAAVDLSYVGDGRAVACYAVVETACGQLVWTHTVCQPVRFPYITGYLAFREVPVLLELLKQVRAQRPVAEVVFVDGNGRLHPRRAGIACQLGVWAGIRTVGVGKKLLCGRVDQDSVKSDASQPVMDGDELLGTAMRATDKNRPIFVSPGHRIDVADATRLANLLFHGHRLPEPIFHADAISRLEAKKLP
ncbi:endonuclease V [Thalassoroseus pseudoceratinae]|uniref:endonuclease V n=1 Tax=Thalassoroseus pseudoceratinae TaxID=2713176 RepID=UPI00142287B6|nr:endonuclease V [Thalassoroseus pseudoceratinae]